MKRFFYPIAFSLVVAVPPATASELTAREMLPHCEEALNHVNSVPGSRGSYCLGVLQGIGMMMVMNCITHQKYDVAIPEHFRMSEVPHMEEVLKAFVAAAQTVPSFLDRKFDVSIVTLYSDLWPCSTRSGSS